MVVELQKALNQIERLPANRQKVLGKLLLEELKWEVSFSSSQQKLETLAEEAVEEYKKGKTKNADW